MKQKRKLLVKVNRKDGSDAEGTCESKKFAFNEKIPVTLNTGEKIIVLQEKIQIIGFED